MKGKIISFIFSVFGNCIFIVQNIVQTWTSAVIFQISTVYSSLKIAKSLLEFKKMCAASQISFYLLLNTNVQDKLNSTQLKPYNLFP